MTNLPPTKKSLGQHWLNDEASLTAICQAADISANDTVLEIGPGPGALTKLLVQQAKRVIAVEFDKKLAADLPGRIGAANLDVHHQDILSFDLTGLPANYKIVANIPYYLTSNLIRVISETSNPPVSATILVQKEVAERTAAAPGSMSLLSVTAQFYWQVGLGPVVPAELFTPPPKVDSQLLLLQRRDEPLFPDIDPKAFFRLVKAGFAQRRKTLLNSLGAGLRLSREEAEAVLQAAKIESGRRAQTLSLEEWHSLYQTLNT
jgi:16S rRNA (adenine1518-N6/adenine1519-N6)-dimethyltransferase